MRGAKIHSKSLIYLNSPAHATGSRLATFCIHSRFCVLGYRGSHSKITQLLLFITLGWCASRSN